jgi:type 1 fimbria pilin
MFGLLLVLACLPPAARADCGYVSGSATTVNFNAGTITLTPSTQLGSVLWTSSTASPTNPPVLACNGTTNGGIVNIIAPSTPVNGDNTLFPTGIPGISYRLLHPDSSTLLALYPYYPVGFGVFTFSVTTNLQLVYTGPYLPPNNSTLSGQLSQWNIDICDKPQIQFGSYYTGCKHNGTVAPRPVETFNINATILIQVPTCTIAPGSISKSVTLPSAQIQQLTGQGTTTGKTPFSLQLTQCPTGLHVYVTLDTTNPQIGDTGVIAPTTGAGYASGVGVQILHADGTTPIAFGSAINTGTTAASNYNIDLFARYYQTGTTVSPGTVKGVATYTINYQ